MSALLIVDVTTVIFYKMNLWILYGSENYGYVAYGSSPSKTHGTGYIISYYLFKKKRPSNRCAQSRTGRTVHEYMARRWKGGCCLTHASDSVEISTGLFWAASHQTLNYYDLILDLRLRYTYSGHCRKPEVMGYRSPRSNQAKPRLND